MRASTADEAIRPVPPRILNLEQAIEYIDEDEFVEVAVHPAAQEGAAGESVVDAHARGEKAGDMRASTADEAVRLVPPRNLEPRPT